MPHRQKDTQLHRHTDTYTQYITAQSDRYRQQMQVNIKLHRQTDTHYVTSQIDRQMHSPAD